MLSRSTWDMSTVLQQHLYCSDGAGVGLCPSSASYMIRHCVSIHPRTYLGQISRVRRNLHLPSKDHLGDEHLSKWSMVSSINMSFPFLSLQPLRLIPVNCRNFFRRLQPMSSELTPMVRIMKGFLVDCVLSCWWLMCVYTVYGSSC